MTTITNTTTSTTTSAKAATTLTDADLLGLVWLASPALPVGGFSYSEVLEAAVESALVTDESSAANWLSDQLHLTLARGDIAVLAAAVTAWRGGDMARIIELNDWVLQTRETSELRQQTEQMGRSVVEWMRSIKPETQSASWTYPVAMALASSAGNASPRVIALTFAFGWAENMIQAAIKSIPLGQSSGQRILMRLASEIPGAVDHALALETSAWQAFSPMFAILSAQHETQYSRLFRS